MLRTTTLWMLWLIVWLPGIVLCKDTGSKRPAPITISRFATPVTMAGRFGRDSEGKAFLRTLPVGLVRKLMEDKYVLLPEETSTAGSFSGYIRALTLFHQPKKEVYDLILNFDDQGLYQPRLDYAKSVTRTRDSDLVHFRLKVLLLEVNYWTQHWMYPEYSRIEWNLADGYKQELKMAEGFWQLFEVKDDMTIAVYGTRINTGFSVPAKIQYFLTKQDIPSALEAFIKYISSGGTYRKTSD